MYMLQYSKGASGSYIAADWPLAADISTEQPLVLIEQNHTH